MTVSETCDIRLGQIQEPKCKALISFVAAVLEKKGDVSDVDVKAARDAGYTDGQITEILLTIAINYFTNIFNLVNNTKIDFPVVLPRQKVAV